MQKIAIYLKAEVKQSNVFSAKEKKITKRKICNAKFAKMLRNIEH